jgi:predicted nucleic acid-binding protein
MTVLVDSDVLIEVTRAKNREIVSRWTELAESGTAILCSPVSVAELWAGARSSEYAALTAFFDGIACAAADETTGKLAGDFLREFKKSHDLELADAMIAAAAVQNHAALWTRNKKHYPMKGLSLL